MEADNRKASMAEPPASDPPVAREIRRIMREAMIESGASLQTPTTVHGGMTAAGFQGVRSTYHKPGPELRDTVVRWSERVLQAMLSHSLLRLGEAESMDAARRRTGELVEEYMRECPEWGAVMAEYVSVVGQRAC